MTREMSAYDARTQLGEVLDRVRYTREPCIISRHGKPVAVIVDFASYEAGQRLCRQAELPKSTPLERCFMTAMAKQASEWLKRAKSDLQYARVGERETRQHHITCFLCQQVVEKALKGLIVLSGKIPERTHGLGRLGSMVVPEFPWLKKLLPKIRRLDKYYTTARYPDDLTFEFSPEDAEEALAIGLV